MSPEPAPIIDLARLILERTHTMPHGLARLLLDGFGSPGQVAEELISKGISHGGAARELQRKGPWAEEYISPAPDVPLAGFPHNRAAGLAI